MTYNISKRREIAALRELGWLSGWACTDPALPDFAPAVRTFQQRAGIAVDGACGPNTWAALRAEKAPLAWLRKIPHGIDDLIRVYGKIGQVAPVRIGIFPGSGRAVRVHPLLAGEVQVLLELAARLSNYRPADVQTYNVRRKRGGGGSRSDYSTHSWAIALDIDPPLNPWGNRPGSPLVDHPEFLAVFRAAGWRCGADWSNPDTMHVQAVTGY